MNKRLFSVLLVLMMAVIGVFGSQAQETVDITIRCKANVQGGEGWRCDNFSEIESQVEEELGIDLNLTLIQDDIGWEDYKTEFLLSTEAGDAPDIILSGHEDIGSWAPAGYIIPLDDKLGDYPEFDDVVSTLWESQKWDGQIWGVPQDAEARPIFYSKLLLSDLGWSDEEIESLPDRVASGDFTFDDMVATAQQAIEEGIIEEGFGYWHRGSNGFDWFVIENSPYGIKEE